MSQTLKEKYRSFMSLPFPAWADDDALSDWQSKLAEVDGFVAGMVSRAIGGEKVDSSIATEHILQLQAEFNEIHSISASDITIRDECKAYLMTLEDLVRSLC